MNFGSKKDQLKTFFVNKESGCQNFLPLENCWSKTIWSEKNFGPKTFWPEEFMTSEKRFKKMFQLTFKPKKLWLKKFAKEKTLVLKKKVQKNFGIEKNWIEISA